MHTPVYLLLVSLLPSATPNPLHADNSSLRCPLIFDGRIPNNATGVSFSTGTLPYNPAYDLGANLTWSDVLLFSSHLPASIFDAPPPHTFKPVEVTINDSSIFTPSPTNAQTGFRRAELLAEPPSPDFGQESTTGVKTLHFSLQSDARRPLNYSHEYQLVWLESADFSKDQVTVGAGTLFGESPDEVEEGGRVLFVRGTSAASPQQTLFLTPFAEGEWYNFALTLDFDTNVLDVYFSTGNGSLERVTAEGGVENDLSGNGEYHFGVLKKPTGEGLTDITRQGLQESGIEEGIVYGGIVLEDSEGGCVSLG